MFLFFHGDFYPSYLDKCGSYNEYETNTFLYVNANDRGILKLEKSPEFFEDFLSIGSPTLFTVDLNFALDQNGRPWILSKNTIRIKFEFSLQLFQNGTGTSFLEIIWLNSIEAGSNDTTNLARFRWDEWNLVESRNSRSLEFLHTVTFDSSKSIIERQLVYAIQTQNLEMHSHSISVFAEGVNQFERENLYLTNSTKVTFLASFSSIDQSISESSVEVQFQPSGVAYTFPTTNASICPMAFKSSLSPFFLLTKEGHPATTHWEIDPLNFSVLDTRVDLSLNGFDYILEVASFNATSKSFYNNPDRITGIFLNESCILASMYNTEDKTTLYAYFLRDAYQIGSSPGTLNNLDSLTRFVENPGSKKMIHTIVKIAAPNYKCPDIFNQNQGLFGVFPESSFPL